MDLSYEGYVGITNNPNRRCREHEMSRRFPENTKFTILSRGTKEMCFREEARLRPNSRMGWNIAPGGIDKSIGLLQKAGAVRKRRTLTEEHKLRLSAAHLGKPKSEAHRKAMKIPKNTKGMAKPKVTCPHCHKQGGKPTMTRFHFDQCKERIA
jgi:hypothetical protein